jgi:pyruvate ferredoxin oxidoreductase gamma subunit
MIEIRVHGRGGMGSITLVEILAKAAGLDDKFSQAFGAFGPERRGAPVRAFCRLDDSKITLRTQVYRPDYIIILDPTLMELPEVRSGVKPDTVFIVNSKESPEAEQKAIGLKNKVYTFDATELALEIIGKDIVNTAMLGSFAKVTGLVTLKSISKVLGERFSGKLVELNEKLVNQAYEKTVV